RPLTNNTPKCLLNIGGKAILERTIDNLIANDIKEIIIVTGYLEDQIRSFLTETYPDIKFNFIYNNIYDSTNNIYSLWMTKESVLDDEIILLDSDIVFDSKIIGMLINSNYENCLAVRSDHQLGDEEIKLTLNEDKSIKEISKVVDSQIAIGESIGIEKFSRKFVVNLFNILDRMILDEKKVDVFYEAAFQKAIDNGLKVFPVDVGELGCMEIDTIEDFEDAGKFLTDKID
ncbi:MAG: phosphocholine cytidylyltransferase family protein, partial [Candidatus Pacebacteria bacterium]|nr:phosphocholine cytidylyltransferase family protein [Candidatus Paceibacterota bacterium]